jgi:hypothetical protein
MHARRQRPGDHSGTGKGHLGEGFASAAINRNQRVTRSFYDVHVSQGGGPSVDLMWIQAGPDVDLALIGPGFPGGRMTGRDFRLDSRS